MFTNMKLAVKLDVGFFVTCVLAPQRRPHQANGRNQPNRAKDPAYELIVRVRAQSITHHPPLDEAQLTKF